MRSAVVDLASQPIRNRAPDPRVTRWSTDPPIQPGAGNNRWTAYCTFSLVAGATDGPAGVGLTTYGRLTVTGTQIGLGFHLAENPEAGSPTPSQMLPVVAGQAVTMAFYVRSSVDMGANTYTYKYRWANGSTWVTGATTLSMTLAAGVWTRIAVTPKAPAGATHLSLATQYGVAPTVGSTLDVTGLQFIDGPDPGRYLDGNNTGWRWTGTAGASESAGYPFGPVRNLAAYPYPQATVTGSTVWNSNRWFGNPANGVNPAGTHSIVTAGLPVGIPRAVRKTWTVGVDPAGHIGDTGFDIGNNTGNTGANGNRWQVTPGEVYTASAFMRTSTANKIPIVSFYWFDSTGTVLASGSRTNVISPTLKANVWTRVSGTATVPAGVYGMAVKPDISINNVSADYWLAGDWLEATGLMVTAGSTLYPYMDGSAPGWQWTGAAGASVSAGYAASTLDSIAGSPLASVSAPGTSSSTLGLGGYEARTVYVVHDVIDNSAQVPTLAATGASASSGPGRFTVRANGTGGATIEARYQDSNNGTAYFAGIANGARLPGRHVSVGSVSEGLTAMSITADGIKGATTALTPGTGLHVGTNCLLWLGPTLASDRPQLAAVYRGEHPDDVKGRVTAWLARMYGGSLVAGY